MAQPSTPLNPLNAKLKPICHLLALLKAHLIFHVSRIRVKLYGEVNMLPRVNVTMQLDTSPRHAIYRKVSKVTQRTAQPVKMIRPSTTYEQFSNTFTAVNATRLLSST
jgi:hypothetical protein